MELKGKVLSRVLNRICGQTPAAAYWCARNIFTFWWQRRDLLRDQLEVLRGMWEDSRQEGRAGGRAARNHWEGELKLTKLSEQDDIEAYLTTYERMMVIYEVPEERWAVRLAPLLTGKA